MLIGSRDLASESIVRGKISISGLPLFQVGETPLFIFGPRPRMFR